MAESPAIFDSKQRIATVTILYSEIAKHYADSIENSNAWPPYHNVPGPFDYLDQVVAQLAETVGAFSFRQSKSSREIRSYYPGENAGQDWVMGAQLFLNPPSAGIWLSSTNSWEFKIKGTDLIKVVLDGDFLSKNGQGLEIRSTILKTQINYCLTFGLGYLRPVSGDLRKRFVDVRDSCQCPPEHLIPCYEGSIVSLLYVCPICSRTYMCSCFKRVSSSPFFKHDQENRKKFLEHETINDWIFRENVCNLCRDDPPMMFFVNYGSDFERMYWPWITKEIEIHRMIRGYVDRDLQLRIENNLRESLGLKNRGKEWLGEALLFKKIMALFGKSTNVFRNFSPDFLKGLRYDIFLSELSMAIEYDGIQHQEPVKRFGGEEGHKATIERDMLKDKLSEEKGIYVLRVTPNYLLEDITASILERAEEKGLKL